MKGQIAGSAGLDLNEDMLAEIHERYEWNEASDKYLKERVIEAQVKLLYMQQFGQRSDPRRFVSSCRLVVSCRLVSSRRLVSFRHLMSSRRLVSLCRFVSAFRLASSRLMPRSCSILCCRRHNAV